MEELNVDAGALDKRIEIVERVKTYDTARYETIKDKLIRRCWAQFTRQSGTESLRQGADLGTIKVRFLIRTSPVKISRLYHVKYNGEYYAITYVNHYGDRGGFTEILAELRELGGAE